MLREAMITRAQFYKIAIDSLKRQQREYAHDANVAMKASKMSKWQELRVAKYKRIGEAIDYAERRIKQKELL